MVGSELKAALVAGALAVCATIVACGGDDDVAPAATGVPKFDVGGYSMSIKCTGEGDPTVILSAGSYGDTTDWEATQAKVAEYTRVCSFDRPNLGNSDKRPATEIVASQLIEEMHTLFQAAGLEPPFAFASHSISGITDRYYRLHHPDEVDGFVLVEAGYEEHFDVLLGEPELVDYNTAIDFRDAFRELRADRDLGDMPLVVLHGGAHTEYTFTDALWLQTHREEAALSTNSALIEASQSAHFPHEQQPDVVAESIRAVVDAVRASKRIAECEAIIAGLDAKCLAISE